MPGQTDLEGSESDRICLGVADLQLWIDYPSDCKPAFIPPTHRPFLCHPDRPSAGDLVLHVRNKTRNPVLAKRRPLCRTEIWELWLDDEGCYIFVDPLQSIPRWLVIQPDFTTGEVMGCFPAGSGPESYLLNGLEIRLFANWLAGKGDLILHAAGIEVEQQGYCFLGDSGAGKSTLAASLVKYPGVRILGEDQVILRWQEGCFWIYGTPWHLEPGMCSPGGVPLRKIFFLNRYAEKTVEALSRMEGVTRILQIAFIPYYRTEALPVFLERLDYLSEQAPFMSLAYHLGSDILSTIRAA